MLNYITENIIGIIVVFLIWAGCIIGGTVLGIQIQKNREPKYRYNFCPECCWVNEFGNHKIYTCTDRKEDLFRRIN